jgi:acetyl esterase/lipase
MKPRIPIIALACLFAGAALAQPVQTEATLPTDVADSSAIPIYGTANPGKPSDEMSTGSGRDVRNVTYPTLIPVLPTPGTANGTAVVVAPGGGFMFLSMDGEGWRVAEALADHGITAFLLKYRLNPTPEDDTAYQLGVLKLILDLSRPGPRPEAKDSGAGQDALAALKLVRSRADDWGVDPDRVGMIGFSAGAITTLKAVLEADNDDDPETLPPDFFAYIYGPMESVPVPENAPPMFVALAMDDGIFSKGDFGLATAWRDAKRPVELHVYQTGGHGFGLGAPGTTNALLMTEFLRWMGMQGLLEP